MTLTEFLLDRIAVEQEIADSRHIWNCPANPDYKGTTTGGRCECSQRRVITDLQAKRRIVDEASELLALSEGTSVWLAAAAHAVRTLRHLATVYANHPNYCEEWHVRAVMAADAEKDGLRAKVARVEALADTYENIQPTAPNWNSVAGNIRAALRGDE